MNKELAKIFYAIAYYLEMEGISFKPQAYHKVAEILDTLKSDISNIYIEGGVKKLQEIPGIGKSIALQIEEYIKTGRIKMFDDYYKRIPVRLFDLLSINGLGPKTIYSLYLNLGIKDVSDLKEALREGKIRKVPRLGEKMEIKLKKSLNFYDREKINVPSEKELAQTDDKDGDLVRLSDICGDLHIHTPRSSFAESVLNEEKQI